MKNFNPAIAATTTMSDNDQSPAIPISEIPWNLGIHDAHCHPTDTMPATAQIPTMKASHLTIMATRYEDQPLVAAVARSHPNKIIPSFGYHPWFSHLIYDDEAAPHDTQDEAALKLSHYSRVLIPAPGEAFIQLLPVPKPLSTVLAEMRTRLDEFEHALVGEIGLDRGFRLPYPQGHENAPSGTEPSSRRLSPHRVCMTHQKQIFKSQLSFAGSLGRAVSVHGVQCHGILFDTFREVWAGHEIPRERRKDRKRRRRKIPGGEGHEYLPDLAESDIESGEEDTDVPWTPKPFPPRICLHSFSAPLETLRQYLSPPSSTSLCPSKLFFSFSTTINARPQRGHLGKIEETIAAVPDESVLVESDLHVAGDELDEALRGAVLYINQVKGWGLDYGVVQLGDNWRRFVYGE